MLYIILYICTPRRWIRLGPIVFADSAAMTISNIIILYTPHGHNIWYGGTVWRRRRKDDYTVSTHIYGLKDDFFFQ